MLDYLQSLCLFDLLLSSNGKRCAALPCTSLQKTVPVRFAHARSVHRTAFALAHNVGPKTLADVGLGNIIGLLGGHIQKLNALAFHFHVTCQLGFCSQRLHHRVVRQRERYSQSNGVVRLVRQEILTAGQVNIVRAVVVTAATHYTFLALCRPLRIGFCAVVVLPEPVLTPLAYIAGHVIQPQFVRLFLFYLVFLESGVGGVPGNSVAQITSRKPETFTFAAATRRILPFRLCGKPEGHTRQAVQPVHKQLRVLPGNVCNRLCRVIPILYKTPVRHHRMP